MNNLKSNDILASINRSMNPLLSRNKNLQAIIKRIIDKAKSYNVLDITTELKLVIKEAGDKSYELIHEIIKSLESAFGRFILYVVNKESLPSARGVREVKGLEAIREYVEMGSVPRILTIILAREDYINEIRALKKILSEIYETDTNWIIASLAVDQINELWPKIELFLIKESSYRPPIIHLLPLIHVGTSMKNKEEALLFIEDMARRLGLVARVWKRSRTIDTLINRFKKILQKYDRIEILVKSLYLLLKNKATLSEICSVLIFLLPLDDKHKETLLIKTGCIFSGTFLNELDKEIDLSNALRELSKCLMNAERTWAPEVSIAELLGMAWLAYVSSRILLEWIKNKINLAIEAMTSRVVTFPEDFLDILKLAMVIALSEVKCKSNDCKLVVRMLLSIRKRFLEYPISLFSNIIEAVRNFTSDLLSTAIYLQRILEIHGHFTYLYLLNNYFQNRDLVKVISIQHIIQSRLGILARKIISYAMKNEEVRRDINKKLMSSDFNPHGVTAPLQWELRFLSISKLSEMVNLAKHYMEDCGVEPNRLLILLDQLLALYPKIKEIKSVIRKKEISALKEAFIDLSMAARILKLITDALRRLYGSDEAPLINKIRTLILNYQGSLNEAWERVLLRDYVDIISGKSKEKSIINIPSIIGSTIKKDAPLIMLVIDGLRIDDYLVKLKEALLSTGFKILKEESLISLIPSITAVSRKAIFGGSSVLKIFSTFPRRNISNLKREDELFREFYGGETIYLQGAVAHVKNIITSLERSNGLKKINAIVLSELEKAAHGAAEGFLAEISLEYALEVSKLAELFTKILKNKFNSPIYLVIASDHGLGLFTKETETDIKIILKRLSRKGLLDPAHEPYIVERYAMIPTISPDAAILAKNLVDLEFKSDAHAIIASEIGYGEVILKLRGQDLLDRVSAKNVLFLFPKGRKRFLVEKYRKRRVVLHGGLLPIETIVPFAIFQRE